MTSLVVISAGLSNPSSTRLLADTLTSATVDALDGDEVDITTIELRDLAHQITDHMLSGFPGVQLGEAIEALRRADGVIAVTPVFSASYSGLFKSFFDVLEEGLLDGKPVLMGATAGTVRHSLVLDHALRPLMSYLHAVMVPTGVFAATDDFGDEGLDRRASQAAHELATFMGRASRGTRLLSRPLVDEQLENPVPFDLLLRRASGN